MAKVHERFLVLIRLKRRSGLPVILRGHPAEMGYRHIHVPLERSGHRGGLPEDGPEEGGHGKERKVDQWINAGMCAGDRTSLMSPTTEAYSLLSPAFRATAAWKLLASYLGLHMATRFSVYISGVDIFSTSRLAVRRGEI